MADGDARRSFLKEYKSYAEQVLFPTQREVRAILAEWKQPGYWRPELDPVDPKGRRQTSPSPVQTVRTRVKRVESVADKIVRRPDVFPKQLSSESFRKMNDTLGCRVILYFLSHLPLIDRELRRLHDKFEISELEPPRAYLPEELTNRLALMHLKRLDKESGYASVHYILRLRNSSVPEAVRPWFELQVRTIAQDAWGEVEHVLGYKPEKSSSIAVQRQFQIISKQMSAIDEHFNFLFVELTRLQEEVEYQDTDLLNAENLPAELANLGLRCAQSEIDGLLKILVSKRIITVGGLRAISNPKRLDIVTDTFWNVEGRPPKNFELIANLAAISDCHEEAEQVARIKEQIEFLNAWESIRKSKG
jgi:GTP pyrophosphokinase